ncbi:MAG: RNA polymerase sigma factor [Lachnospiraceae bacterium]|nr:RNA polymerase sigma factor [Lachnospiraceae bacterium]
MDNGASSYRRFLEGDDNGIVEIIRDYKDGLILFLNRYVNNIHTAEELAEDTFFRLATRKPRFIDKYAFKTWLYTIGRNIAINHIKHLGKIINIPFEDLERIQNDEDALEQSYIKEEQRILLHKALSKIKSEYSQVLYLKFFEDLPNEQIAVVMKKNKRQIENLIYQAKQSLKSELDKEGYHYEELQ